MLKTEVVAHFGSLANVARALNITRPAVTNWGAVIPFKWAGKITELSGGKLKVNEDLYREVRKMRKKNYGTGKKAADYLLDQ